MGVYWHLYTLVLFRLLLRWPVQRPSRMLGKLEVEQMDLFLATTPAAWSCLAPSPTGLVFSPQPPSPPALELAPVPCTSIIITTICTLSRLSICRTRCLTPSQRAMMRPRLTSSYLRYRHHQHLLLHRFVIRGKRGMEASQESSQVRPSTKTTFCFDRQGKGKNVTLRSVSEHISNHPTCQNDQQQCQHWFIDL